MARVLVLCGGESLERRVSLASGDAVAKGLVEAGHTVRKIDTASPRNVVDGLEPLLIGVVGATPPEELIDATLSQHGWAALIDTIANEPVDCIFPILHGGWGEDGRIQAMLELLKVPYLGSGVLASQLCMNKQLTKDIALKENAPVAKGFIADRDMLAADAVTRIETEFGWPAVIKPLASGSAVDVYIVKEPEGVEKAICTILAHGDIPFVEEYIPGKELTVTILGESAYPVVEIRPKTSFYDYTRKYTKGETEYICPAPIPEELAEQISHWSEMIFASAGCRHLARIDWRWDGDAKLAFLEVNTIPGMTALSLVPMAAKERGIDFPALMDMLVSMTLD